MKKIMLQHTDALTRLASRYVWWNTVDWAYAHPDIFLACVMDLANWDDMQSLRQSVSSSILKIVLMHAPAGSFHARSWDYWHVKLGVSLTDLPKRKL